MSKKLKANLIMMMTAVIWGFAFVAQLLGTDHVGTLTFNGIRFLMGCVSLIPVMLIFEGTKTQHKKLMHTIKAGALAGVFLFGGATLQQYGIVFTQSAGKSGFISSLYIVIVPIVSIFFGKKTKVNTWFGAIIVAIGLYLLCFSQGFGAVGIGDIVLLASAIMWTFQILVIDFNADKIYSLRFAMVEFFVCGILSIILAFIFEDISLASIFSARYPILYAGLMSVGVAYTCQIIGQKHADPTTASIIMSFESVFSALGEAIMFTFILTNRNYTPLSLSNYIGCAIMFLGIVISQLNFKIKSRNR